MMTTVKLGGLLGKEFGYVWQLDIDRPVEAIRAIEANRPGLRQRIIDLSEAGLEYRIRLNGRPIDESELSVRSGGQTVTIMPIVRGAGSTGQMVIGAALIAAAIVIAPGGAAGLLTADGGLSAYGTVAMVGATMVLGGVVQMLTPTASLSSGNSSSKNSAYAFGSTDNVSGQGYAIPVGYGKCLTGSIIVNAGVFAEDMSAYSSANPTLQGG